MVAINVRPKPLAWNVRPHLVASEWRWAHELAVAIYPFWGHGNIVRDISMRRIGGDLLRQSAANNPWNVRQPGMGLFGDGTDSVDINLAAPINTPNPGYWHDAFSEMTMFCYASIEGDTDSGQPILIEATGAGNGWAVYYRKGTDTISFHTAISTSEDEIKSASTDFALEDVAVCARFDNGAKELFVNGRSEGTSSVAATVPSRTNEPAIGGSAGGQGLAGSPVEWLGTMFVMYLFDVALPDARVFQLMADPFGPLRRKRVVIGRAPVVAAADPLLGGLAMMGAGR